MLGVEYDSSAIEPELIPDDHRHELSAYHLWVKLADIEPIEKDWLMANLEPVRKPGTLISLGIRQVRCMCACVRSRSASLAAIVAAATSALGCRLASRWIWISAAANPGSCPYDPNLRSQRNKFVER
jgi:hypothetical protein